MNESRMDRADHRRRSLLIGGASGLVLSAQGLAGCATSSQPTGPVQAFEQPLVRLGDRWFYREINRYNQLPLADVEVTVTGTTPLTCSVRRTRSDTTAGEIARPDAIEEERYAAPWSVTLEPTYDLTMEFAEPMPIVPPTLRVGESVNSKTTYTVRGYSGQFGWRQRLKAVGVEPITTPAGYFDCLRVQRTTWFDYPDVFRFDSSRIDTVWYSPEVNRWVRREWTGDYLHENSLGKMGGMRRREDWVRWDLLSYQPAAGTAG